MKPARRFFVPSLAAMIGAAMTITMARAENESLESVVRWLSPELRRIGVEQRVLHQMISDLPPSPPRTVTERLGYHSGYSSRPDTVEWVEMDLHKEESIDAIVLIAAASGDGGLASDGYGFPLRFRVETRGEGEAAEHEVLADFTRGDFPNPGILPVYLPVSGRKARYVRIIAARLYQEEKRFFFALGEIMILQGNRNLASALRLGDFRCSRTKGAVPIWGLANLVDGHTVLGPPVGQRPSPTLGYQSRLVNVTIEPVIRPRWVQIDLGAELAVEEVRLFPARPPEFAHRQGFGFPFFAKLELSNDVNFKPAIEIPEFTHHGPVKRPPQSSNPGDNVVTYVVHGRSGRYVRFTALDLHNANGQYNLALAEMQVWSGGGNVALGKTVNAFDSIETGGWSGAALVDGFNSRANIVEWPEWLSGLSRRREILQQIAQVEMRQAALLGQFASTGWWALLGTVTGVPAILLVFRWRQRRQHRREMEELRHRISQDLHDEIGSSLGSIVFISQDLMALVKSDRKMQNELGEIQSIARQTVDSMHDIARVMQSDRYAKDDLISHVREIATRMLRTVTHTVRLDDGRGHGHFPRDRHRDLVLMFKEALHNILQHSQATHVEIVLAHAARHITLSVRDNGRGFDPATTVNGGGMGLTNLRRRADKLGGEMSLVSAPRQGTTLVITIPCP